MLVASVTSYGLNRSFYGVGNRNSKIPEKPERSVSMSEIITEYRNENTKNIDLLSTIDIVRKINEEINLLH